MDTIADMFTMIKNAQLTKKESVFVPYSKIKLSLAEKFLKLGFLKFVEKRNRKNKKFLEIGLFYKENGKPAIEKLSRVSKLSRRIYMSMRDLENNKLPSGIRILSTTRGILTDKEAIKEKVGGEVICIIE